MQLLRPDFKKVINLFISIHKIANSYFTVTREGKSAVTTQQDEHSTVVALYFDQIMKRCKQNTYVIYMYHTSTLL